jgi:archaemetzincin
MKWLLVFAVAACSEAPKPIVQPPKVVASAAPSPSASATTLADPKLVVHMIPLGDVALDDLKIAEKGLREQAPFAIKIEDRLALPDSAKTAEKARFSADALLAFLQHFQAMPRDKVLGVTDVDIVTPKNNVNNWGILGLGDMAGKTCVISTYRMRRKWEPGGGAPESLVRERLWKISLHELGHTFGLPHCPNKGCLMQDAHGTVKTVDEETALCSDCRARFTDVLQ